MVEHIGLEIIVPLWLRTDQLNIANIDIYQMS